ncbi:hypothetical protein ACIBAI_06145 [Streptomyces sp. NPDC051041]|uniref:hypothetical protein n=1 Tax=Streptomyces sp. NPDC051041 TaxID=3365640 RepID=UPI0037884147
MHRTTTTAALLATVALAVLPGCTTVRGAPAAVPSAGASRLPTPHPDGPAEPRIVQAPVREALELVGPSRRPARPTLTPRTDPAAPAPGRRPSAGPPEQRRPQPPPPVRPGPRERASRPPEHPRVQPPGVPETARGNPGGGIDVCALGRTYGGWRADSREARICEQTYGR